MEITMLDTVEDSHATVVTNPETHKPKVVYDVTLFRKGQFYPSVEDDRAKKLIKMKFAVEGDQRPKEPEVETTETEEPAKARGKGK